MLEASELSFHLQNVRTDEFIQAEASIQKRFSAHFQSHPNGWSRVASTFLVVRAPEKA